MNSKTGYSGSPLAKKLGIKSGLKIKLIDMPEEYFSFFDDFPQEIEIIENPSVKKDLIHAFIINGQLLESLLVELKKEIVPNGTIWISWYKKSAKMNTDITEDLIRKLAIENGLVDVKVCAVNEQWSGLKLVIPIKNRS
jgi:hypothetical protein